MGVKSMYKVMMVRGRESCFEKGNYFPLKWAKGCWRRKFFRVNRNILNKKKKNPSNNGPSFLFEWNDLFLINKVIKWPKQVQINQIPSQIDGIKQPGN